MSVLKISGVSKEFGSVVAVNDVSFSVEKGQVIGLIGPNGAGKTTLLKMLATLLPPTEGQVSVMGLDLLTDYLSIRRHIGYLPDFFNLYNDLTLSECVRFFARVYRIEPERIDQLVEGVLKFVDLYDRRNEFVKNLSRGMVQRLGVAALLVHEPDVFLLDEPASGLDPKARIQLRDILKKLSAQGKTVIISSHILTELSGFCTHIAIMDKGRLHLYGSVDEIERRLKGGSKVNISVLDRVTEAVACVEQLEYAQILSRNDNSFSLETENDSEKIAGINTLLVKNGFKVVNFSEERANLEDLFMKISTGTNVSLSESKGVADAG